MRHDSTVACGDCHDGPGSDGSGLSGAHEKHLEEQLDCVECHALTMDRLNTIIAPELHVDGAIQIVLSEATIAYRDAGCNGTCHLEPHLNRGWYDED